MDIVPVSGTYLAPGEDVILRDVNVEGCEDLQHLVLQALTPHLVALVYTHPGLNLNTHHTCTLLLSATHIQSDSTALCSTGLHLSLIHI